MFPIFLSANDCESLAGGCFFSLFAPLRLGAYAAWRLCVNPLGIGDRISVMFVLVPAEQGLEDYREKRREFSWWGVRPSGQSSLRRDKPGRWRVQCDTCSFAIPCPKICPLPIYGFTRRANSAKTNSGVRSCMQRWWPKGHVR